MFCRTNINWSKAAALLALFVALALVCGERATAQPVNRPGSAKEWSDFIFARYQKVKTMRAYFEQNIVHKESGIEEQRTGELFFKKPFLVRWVSNQPFEELIVVDKNHLWQYFPEEELILKFNAADVDDQSEFLSVLAGRAPLAEKFKIVPQQEVEGVFSLKLLPISPSMNLVEAVVWVDMESGLILRLSYTDFYGNINDISFTNQALDVAIPDDTFKMGNFPGVIIEDYTK